MLFPTYIILLFYNNKNLSGGQLIEDSFAMWIEGGGGSSIRVNQISKKP